MSESNPMLVLFVGATGSVGRLAVDEAVRMGYRVRALVRSGTKARFDDRVEVTQGDLTRMDTLAGAVDGIDAVVFTMGAHDGPTMVERVDYGAVRNVLTLLAGRPVRIVLMTAIGVTYMDSAYNRTSQAHDWKRRSERLVRASGNDYTIVRPGWFDYNGPDQRRLTFLQGDRRRHADSRDGVVSRRQIAQTLISALGCDEAKGKTFELVAEHGPAPCDLTPMFAALEADSPGSVDGVHDEGNFPAECQPRRVREDLARIAAISRRGARSGGSR
ncbi:SDR family oxidoreductase [Bifidobacterium simiarum]|uniref:NAD-dependent dehydratase n=1 Tax=Bifidobacterium simiarum TaxID=2045441 RepID=A0A2M9HHR4_9BIFI|nr:SDR family oxidoreductase [Bifidobacterium simiarum]PJM76378.1 NAD-dependent dehydratase [Bifidobacterium simiarum]